MTLANHQSRAGEISGSRPFTIGLGLEAAGHHHGAGSRASAVRDIFDPQIWLDNVRTARQAGLNYVTIADSFDRRGVGQLDATLVAAWIAPSVSGIGLIPTLTTTHTEPFHGQKNIATLDHISSGWAGWQVAVSTGQQANRLVGRRRADLTEAALYREAQDYVEVARQLWDSWEDDAEIRDAATGRFIDRDKVHYVDFVSPSFSVKGPSIVPRSPQGQPVVAFAGRSEEVIAAAVARGDLLFVPVQDAADARELIHRIRQAEARWGRSEQQPLLIHIDLPFAVAATNFAARARIDQLNTIDAFWGHNDRLRALGTPATVSTLIQELAILPGVDGVRLLPAGNAEDLPALLQLRLPGLPAPAATFRESLGLGRPASRYAREVAEAVAAR